MRFFYLCLIASLLTIASSISAPQPPQGTFNIHLVGQCIHGTDNVRIEFLAYKPDLYRAGYAYVEKQVTLRNGYYTQNLPPDYYLVTVFMQHCVANFDAGAYAGTTRAIVAAPYPVVWPKHPVAQSRHFGMLAAESVQISGDYLADVYEVPRNGLLVELPYDGLTAYLKDSKGDCMVPVTEGRANYFDDVLAGDYTVVVAGNTPLRTFPMHFAGDFSIRVMNLTPIDVHPSTVTPVPAPEE